MIVCLFVDLFVLLIFPYATPIGTLVTPRWLPSWHSVSDKLVSGVCVRVCRKVLLMRFFLK